MYNNNLPTHVKVTHLRRTAAREAKRKGQAVGSDGSWETAGWSRLRKALGQRSRQRGGGRP